MWLELSVAICHKGSRQSQGDEMAAPGVQAGARAWASPVARRLSQVGAWTAVEEAAWTGLGEGELGEDRPCMTPLRGEPLAGHTGGPTPGPSAGLAGAA